MVYDETFSLVKTEYFKATAKFPKFNSAHEGLAVIWEEFEELKGEVFKNDNSRSKARMAQEACQVAAMAVRFITDCIHPKQ